ncbi:MAG: hypothetical protein O9345_05215 [Burkholderiaceae bacterium]|nr:hypothetical protein [Burkholderiales bacterium]MCZ8099173.1 hypothetical protein [Burkholderiales bacterium]MCZ8337544.1 hypothetical protein [Burkholderiaceae bacterium]
MLAVGLLFALVPSIAAAQALGTIDRRLEQRASQLLNLMGFGLTPDVTAGSLSISDGQVERTVPTRWNSLSVTGGGVGWDFPIARDLVLRPILNVSYGRVTTDVAIGAAIADVELQRLQNARFEAVGAGGALMRDYERYRPEGDLDAALRHTNIFLRTSSPTRATGALSKARSTSTT